MGNWRITIEGTGVHHNGQVMVFYYADEPGNVPDIMEKGKTFRVRWGDTALSSTGGSNEPTVYRYHDRVVNLLRWEPAVLEDANIMSQQFVKDLKAKGHQIHTSSFECLNQIEYFSE